MLKNGLYWFIDGIVQVRKTFLQREDQIPQLMKLKLCICGFNVNVYIIDIL